jgi:cyclophilin family peptidyl-prolyl cis-trans isomerase
MTSPLYVEAEAGRPFSYAVTTTGGSTLTTGSVTNLPDGLIYDDLTRTIAGTPSTGDLKECAVSLSFADGWTYQATLVIRVLRAPESITLLADRTIPPTGTTEIDLAGVFIDSDSESAVSVSTNVGDLRLLLFGSSRPLTVSNFMAYALAGDFVDTVFHRSVPGFVVQGGAFRPVATNQLAFASVPTRPPVTNEPGLSSVRGTVAMAKVGGDPDSATNQWFVNLKNNGPILNAQNGGFTVFGRVPLADMAVPDAIESLPRGNYNILLNDQPAGFEDWPLTAATNVMDNALAVKILSVAPVPVLNYSVASNSAPAVVDATVSNGRVVLAPLAGGTATVVVRATDLDGIAAEQSFTVTVPQSFAFWAAAEGLPVGQNGAYDNADGGSLDNFSEFAFVGSATNGLDDAQVRPLVVLSSGAPADRRLTAEFNLRKNAHLLYTVSVGTSLVPSDLAVIWSSASNSLSAANVELADDLGTHHRVRVRDLDQPPGATRRFIALDVREP